MLQLKASQRGMTFLGLLVVGAFLAVSGVIIAQIVPTAIEYQAVLKAVNKASEGNTVAEVRNIFQRATEVDNISSISGKDLEVTKVGDKVVVAFAYRREIHLVGPGYLTLKYSGHSN
jgi:Domain of unknown function (DUF4845)